VKERRFVNRRGDENGVMRIFAGIVGDDIAESIRNACIGGSAKGSRSFCVGAAYDRHLDFSNNELNLVRGEEKKLHKASENFGGREEIRCRARRVTWDKAEV
jgi:hypothetical protein